MTSAPRPGPQEPWRSLTRTLQARIRFGRAVWRDPETPGRTRWLLGSASGCLLLAPALLWLGLRSLPRAVQERHRRLLEQEADPPPAGGD